jgi:hypothetical protein
MLQSVHAICCDKLPRDSNILNLRNEHAAASDPHDLMRQLVFVDSDKILGRDSEN